MSFYHTSSTSVSYKFLARSARVISEILRCSLSLGKTPTTKSRALKLSNSTEMLSSPRKLFSTDLSKSTLAFTFAFTFAWCSSLCTVISRL